MHRYLTITLLGVLMASSSDGAESPVFRPVGGFDLQRYLGTWYEIARFPRSFEKGLDNVTANYSMRPDGMVKVENRGLKNGVEKKAEGKAKFAGASDTGHLRVSFFWIFYGDYIIVELDPDYQWVMISGGSTKYLWFLSRTPGLAPEVLERLKTKATGLGYDLSKLIMVGHEKPESKIE